MKPYTYLIGWSKLGKFYYGVKFGKDANPDTFWKNYFTSSKYVRRLRKEHGEPDVIQIRKTFTTADEAINWETKVLKRVNVLESTKWLNENVAGGLSLKVYDDLKEQLYKPIEVRIYGSSKSLFYKSRIELKKETGLNGTSLQTKLLKDGYLWIRRRKDSKHIFSDGTLLYLPSASKEIDDVYKKGFTVLGKPSHSSLTTLV